MFASKYSRVSIDGVALQSRIELSRDVEIVQGSHIDIYLWTNSGQKVSAHGNVSRIENNVLYLDDGLRYDPSKDVFDFIATSVTMVP